MLFSMKYLDNYNRLIVKLIQNIIVVEFWMHLNKKMYIHDNYVTILT